MVIDEAKRGAVVKVYNDYCEPFLKTIKGAVSKNLFVRDEDVQVFHGFDSPQNTKAYLESELFKNDVFVGLKPLWNKDPKVKIYTSIILIYHHSNRLTRDFVKPNFYLQIINYLKMQTITKTAPKVHTALDTLDIIKSTLLRDG